MRDSTLARLRKHYRLACAVLIALVLAPILLLTLPRSSSEAPSQRPAADMPLQAASLGLVLEDKNGSVNVLAVMQDSPAEQQGMQAGDQLLSLNGEPLSSAAALDTLMEGMEGSGKLSFEVRRQGQSITVDFDHKDGQ